MGHPCALHVQFYLNANHRSYEKGYKQYYYNGIYAKLLHFPQVLPGKHSHSFGT
jgi:hypothetical protein